MDTAKSMIEAENFYGMLEFLCFVKDMTAAFKHHAAELVSSVKQAVKVNHLGFSG